MAIGKIRAQAFSSHDPKDIIINESENGEKKVDLNVNIKDGVNMRKSVKLVKIATVKEYKYKVMY